MVFKCVVPICMLWLFHNKGHQTMHPILIFIEAVGKRIDQKTKNLAATFIHSQKMVLKQVPMLEPRLLYDSRSGRQHASISQADVC